MEIERPERLMVRRALVPGAVAAALAFILGQLIAGSDVALSAAVGISVVTLNFAAHGYSLAWAAGVSVTAVHVVALAGFAVRLGVIVGLMFLFDRTSWFSPLAFGLAVVPATLLLLVYEALLVVRGMGAQLEIPPDPAAVRAAERLAARGALR
jgi:ATP synthase protein I